MRSGKGAHQSPRLRHIDHRGHVHNEQIAILMWATEGAMLDYADKDNLIFNAQKQPMVDATREYTRENSLYWSWFESRMRLGPGDEVDIDLLEAYESLRSMSGRRRMSGHATAEPTSRPP